MTATHTSAGAERAAARTSGRRPASAPQRPNWLGGLVGWLWLAVVIIPIYWIVITSLKTQTNYYLTNPLLPPIDPTLDNYRLVLQLDFPLYFLNSLLVAVGTVIPSVLFAFMAAYAIVRSGGAGRFLRAVNGLFLMGLAIPLQATVIPIYLMIIKLHLYDSLLGLILPSVAFAIPLSVLVLANFIRDVPKELFESMRLDGATEWMTLWRLAFPLTRPAVVTVSIYNALTVWNGFLLPLILTQSPDKRTLPLALAAFQGGPYGVNVPAVLASVVLTILPMLVLYTVGRRQLLSGLTAGFGK
ncbi:carbohydrate ABC transporter permease [Microbispora sp. RL4-1S]|uniref:Carbohydrate ABC transporter permease n=1 Tax=Microbispora oryzae TaxID=2806554 RepID=A0A940WTM2_9ACTN|nr:carbohydrate ABC transporter permease [Microbispora oryzae]MBP2706896.1 carbohydrate ABC transporter permease [Microbispora oryzae]